MGTRTGWKYGDQKAVDAMIHDGLWCAFENWHMGEAAEHIAAKCSVARTDQDRFFNPEPQPGHGSLGAGAVSSGNCAGDCRRRPESEGRDARRRAPT